MILFVLLGSLDGLSMCHPAVTETDVAYIGVDDTFLCEDESCCDFSADAGRVSALIYKAHGGVRIWRFALCEPDLQATVRNELAAEWSDGVDVGRWASASDVLYVLSEDGKFVGCVAVDRRLFVPYISHLLVTPACRGRGHGRLLLNFATRHVASQGFDEARLWCYSSMVPLYSSMGWEVDKHAQPESSAENMSDAPVLVMRRTGIKNLAFAPDSQVTPQAFAHDVIDDAFTF